MPGATPEPITPQPSVEGNQDGELLAACRVFYSLLSEIQRTDAVLKTSPEQVAETDRLAGA